MVLAVACFGLLLPFLRLGSRHRASCGAVCWPPSRDQWGGPMMHLVLVIAIVIILAASCLLTFALCRAATRRDEMEERWASAASCGQEKEERHETA